jgi:hypothetical protein
MRSPAINPNIKFEWFRNHMPEKLDEAKELFIQEVLFCFCSHFFASYKCALELQKYHKEDASAPAQPQVPQRGQPSSHDTDWADDILGLGPNTRFRTRSLHVEVEAYLLDTQFSTSSLSYWQVG